ncbi:MAG: hypothetical protein A2298_02915 [Gammaproteobacteria bacterium RIFOXYB2_FULL_38_6]|nr:MAG: hypothetical protein A2298_02915 [Gammaproteobacteria bacterium RIFOXYB2_FULL_38_6]
MTILVIGIAMSLPAGFYTLLKNFQSISSHWNGSPTISLYLKPHLIQSEIQSLMGTLKKRVDVDQVTYISPEEGIQQFEQYTQFKDVLSILGENPLPPVMVVTPTMQYQTPQALDLMVQAFAQMPQVDKAQLDVVWVKRLYQFVVLSHRLIQVLVILFSLGVILITGNTIRLALQKHESEIAILRLVGATPSFIRRPLLYRGILYGLLGGITAWILIALILMWLESPIEILVTSYGGTFTLQGLSFMSGIKIIFLSSVLSFIGAWLAVRPHLTAEENL